MPDLDDLDLSDFVEDQNDEEQKKYDDLNAGLPSASKAKIEVFRTDKREQWSFTSVPKIIKDLAFEKANELGMGKKEFLYHCLRLAGVDIPSYKDLDARKVIK